MTEYLRFAAAALVGLILTLVVGRQSKDLSLLLSLAVCVLLCLGALEFLEPVTEFLAQLRKLGDPRWLAHILAVWQYDGVARRALLALKYYKSRWRAAELSRQLAAHTAGLPAPDIIIPVPDHPSAAKKRPYSVPALFAERLSRQTGAPVAADILCKHYSTPPQHKLSRQRRKGNPVGAYRVVKPEALRGKTVWLVDDIVTTGATMNECARMLWLYGAQPVTGLCFAITMPDRKEKDAPAAGEEAARQ